FQPEKKFGFGRPKTVWQVNEVKPIPTEKIIKYYLKAKLMSFGLAKFLLQITLAHNFLIGRINCKYKVSQIPSLAEIGNTIFEAASKAFDIIIIRDKDYLSWRFEKNVDDYFYFVAKLRDFPVGYVVLKKAFWGGLKVIYVADFLTLPSHKSCFYSMLSTVYQFALHEKADMISCWVNKCGPYYKSLLFSGYMPFKAMPFIIHPMGKGELFLNDRLSWHLTMSDSDNI
ncbi:MAG: hypothetical protein L6406_14925, partial [Desulfobacterales bacterium]|nr:hypothetical protein [Desulfobacterales bacterium]